MTMGITNDHGHDQAINHRISPLAERTPQTPSDHLAIEAFTSLSFAAKALWLAQIQNFPRQSTAARVFRAQRHPLVQEK